MGSMCGKKLILFNALKLTVYRRLQDESFRHQIQEIRAEMVQRTAATLTAAGSESVKTLLALQQATVPAAVR